MKPSEVLRKAAEKLSKPENWTRRTFARTKFGYSIAPTSDLAVCWCVEGIIVNIQGKFVSEENSALFFLEKSIEKDAAFFNDRIAKTNTDVVNKLNEAATLAESQGM